MGGFYGVQNARYKKNDQGVYGTKHPGAECIFQHLVVPVNVVHFLFALLVSTALFSLSLRRQLDMSLI